ncbi:MAG: DsbA family protein [Proteobacteria bacterium]|nr:DsbA family protein [Pseudomonadota bacterium]
MTRCLSVLAFCLALLAGAAQAQEATTTLDREEIELIVRDYIAAHPEIVVEALRDWQRQAEALQAEAAQQALAARAGDLYDDAETPYAGNAQGDVVIVEFFDYRCGYCRHSATDLFALIDSDPGVKVVFKEFPILGEASRLAARAALASREQDLYFPFHQALMQADIGFSEAEIMAVAESVGLDTAQLKADMADPAIDAYLARTDALARELGVNGTPAFVIDGALYPGALDAEDLDQLVAQGRQG